MDVTYSKIAFLLTTNGWGGLEMNTLKLAKLLKQKGHTLILLTTRNATMFKHGTGVFSEIQIIEKNRKYFDFAAARKINKALKEQNINTLLVFDNHDLDMVALTKWLFFKDLKVIYQQHMQIGINKRDFIHSYRFKAINCWISPLQHLKDEVTVRTTYPASQIEVIPLGVYLPKFTVRSYTKEEALAKLDMVSRKPLLGIIGRISEKKGQLFLVETLELLKQKGYEVELLIFGSATVNDADSQAYFQKLVKTIENKGMKNVHLVPYSADVALFYQVIDVFVLASHSETYGMVTIEAMLSKVPIIATKSGGTAEILGHGKMGLLYMYEDKEACCEKIIEVLEHPNDARQRAELAFQDAVNRYDEQKEVDGIEGVLQKLSTSNA